MSRKTTHRAPRGAISRFRRSLLALTILLVATTAIGIGHARGLVLAGAEVVLCSGGQTVTVRVPGHEGQGRTALCPDMAAGLLAAVAVPPPSVPATAAEWRAAPPAAPTVLPVLMPPPPTARGPPSVVSTA